MKFLADENIPAEIVIFLNDNGIDIISVIDLEQGAEDDRILEIALREKLCLVTFDKDFGMLIFRQQKKSYGVVLLRFDAYDVATLGQTLLAALKKDFQFQSSFIVVEKGRARVVPLP